VMRSGMLGDVEQTAITRAGIWSRMLEDVEQSETCRAGMRSGMLGDVEQTAMCRIMMSVRSINFVVRRETKRTGLLLGISTRSLPTTDCKSICCPWQCTATWIRNVTEASTRINNETSTVALRFLKGYEQMP
jgi:hypothetical protein